MVESQPPNNPTPGLSPFRGTFVGRQREMGELKAALDDALFGQGRLVMLVGEPGIGKTRTAQELAYYAETRGTQVLWGRCYEEEGAPPYWPWLQSLRSYIEERTPEQLLIEMGPGASDIAEVLPELREKLPDLEPPPVLEPEQARFRLFDSITTFLKNAAQQQPLMLVLDDLHWADQPSLLLLQFLAREMGGSRLLVVGTYRDVELSRQHPLSETLAHLSREPVFRREVLGGLSREDTGDFVEVAAGLRPAQGLVESIYLQTEGNPFFMGEIIRLLAEQGELTKVGIGDSPSIRIPEGVREVIGQRLNRLSEQCNRTLVTAAVIGREFDFRLLSPLMDNLNETLLLGLVEEALDSHVIEELPESRERYQFSHALIQETLLGEVSSSRRVRLHARIGEALEEIYGANVEAHAVELAHHFAEAESVLGTEKLVHYSLLAGEQALAAYAWEEALTHFERGLVARDITLAGTEAASDEEAAALLFGLGRAQDATLQNEEARASLSRALDYYVEVAEVPGAVAIAEYPLQPVSGRVQLTQLVTRALALVPADSHEAGRLLSTYGLTLYQETGDSEGAQAAFSRSVTIAQHEGDLNLEMRTLAAAADVNWYHLRFQEVLEKGGRAIELACCVDDTLAEVRARFYVGLSLDLIGDLEGMRGNAVATLTAAERLRDRPWLANAFWINGVMSSREGDWRTARDFLNQGLVADPQAPPLLFTRALLEYEVGDFDQGAADLERFLEVVRMTAPGPNGPYAITPMMIAMIARITGVVEELAVASATAKAVLSSPSATPLFTLHARTGLALLAALRGDTAAVAEQYAALDFRRGMMQLWMGTDHVLGILSLTMGKINQATAHFEDALAFCRQAGYRPEHAWTCYDYAETLLHPLTSSGRADSSNRAKAISLLEEALSISRELGMVPLAERVAGRLEGMESAQRKAPAYPDGLTQREVEVLRLVATGMSNPEIAQELFISSNTVKRHLTNIFSKTSATGRAEAAVYAAQHDLLRLL